LPDLSHHRAPAPSAVGRSHRLHNQIQETPDGDTPCSGCARGVPVSRTRHRARL